MKIKFLGAAGTVTGSSYVLTSTSGQPILIDLGMFQGPHVIEELNYKPYDYDCSKLIGALLTHAHLDHCGRLPLVTLGGYKGDIFMTQATAELAQLSLLDTAHIAAQEDRPILYDKDQAKATMMQFKPVKYREQFSIGDFRITYRDAGHLLGSASIEIEDVSSPEGKRHIVFSGDLGNSPEDLLMPTELIDRADIVVMESTYGDRLHPAEDAMKILQDEINAVEQTDGVLLIPAFSLQRTQEILHMIMHLKQEQKVLAHTSVYLDSPMAEAATRIYQHSGTLMNDHTRPEVAADHAFSFPGLDIVERTSQSHAIDKKVGPGVIIAGSGMMTGGRILFHAKTHLPDAKTRLLIVGYQGEGTLGRMLAEGAPEVNIDGEVTPVNAKVTVTRGMSSHADQKGLVAWLKHIQGVKKVVLTHGDDAPRAELSKVISSELGITDIVLPHMNEELEI
jgi:metallo-beta-lactamase family protein